LAATKLVFLNVGSMDTPEAAPAQARADRRHGSNPDVTIDARALPSDIQWHRVDRVARTTVSAGARTISQRALAAGGAMA
jgi:hypothetical protein